MNSIHAQLTTTKLKLKKRAVIHAKCATSNTKKSISLNLHRNKLLYYNFGNQYFYEIKWKFTILLNKVLLERALKFQLSKFQQSN